MLKKREQIKQILELNLSEEQKIEKIANLNTIKTDINRVILIDDIEDLELEEGQTVKNLGNSWADSNKDCEYMAEDEMGNVEVVFTAEDVEAYEVQYLDIDHLMFDLDIEEEEAEEIALDEVYQDLLWLLGTDADASQEAEILVSNEKEFTVKEISIDESINLIEVKLI